MWPAETALCFQTYMTIKAAQNFCFQVHFHSLRTFYWQHGMKVFWQGSNIQLLWFRTHAEEISRKSHTFLSLWAVHTEYKADNSITDTWWLESYSQDGRAVCDPITTPPSAYKNACAADCTGVPENVRLPGECPSPPWTISSTHLPGSTCSHSSSSKYLCCFEEQTVGTLILLRYWRSRCAWNWLIGWNLGDISVYVPGSVVASGITVIFRYLCVGYKLCELCIVLCLGYNLSVSWIGCEHQQSSCVPTYLA